MGLLRLYSSSLGWSAFLRVAPKNFCHLSVPRAYTAFFLLIPIGTIGTTPGKDPINPKKCV